MGAKSSGFAAGVGQPGSVGRGDDARTATAAAAQAGQGGERSLVEEGDSSAAQGLRARAENCRLLMKG